MLWKIKTFHWKHPSHLKNFPNQPIHGTSECTVSVRYENGTQFEVKFCSFYLLTVHARCETVIAWRDMTGLFVHVLVCTYLHLSCAGVYLVSLSWCMCVVLCVWAHCGNRVALREPFGNNSSLLLGIPCFLFLRTSCPSCNTITVTTAAIAIATSYR